MLFSGSSHAKIHCLTQYQCCLFSLCCLSLIFFMRPIYVHYSCQGSDWGMLRMIRHSLHRQKCSIPHLRHNSLLHHTDGHLVMYTTTVCGMPAQVMYGTVCLRLTCTRLWRHSARPETGHYHCPWGYTQSGIQNLQAVHPFRQCAVIFIKLKNF